MGLAENHPLYLLWIIPAKEEWIMFSGSLGFFSPQAKISFVSTLVRTKPISGNLKRIDTHIFNQQLFDGTLNRLYFLAILHDDCIYLHHYALALNKLSTRTVDINPTLTQHFKPSRYKYYFR